jgi:hypothetical protein
MIVKDILSGEIYTTSNLCISSFKPSGLVEILGTIPEQHFILGVGYNEGDYQICISGRKKSTEDIIHTFSREMYEELSIVPTKPLVVFSRKTNNHFTKIHIGDTQLLNPDLFEESDKDDTKERGIICVHGSFVEIVSYLTKVKIHPQNSDCITHIWADTAKNILQYI